VKFVAIGSKLVYLDDCSGGNSRLSYPARVWGAVIFWSKSRITDIDPHYGIEPTVRFLTLLPVRSLLDAVATLLTRLGTDLGTDVRDYAALGVFFWFQVSDFDRCLGFFSLCHFIFPIWG
jgi:hypothetical protein